MQIYSALFFDYVCNSLFFIIFKLKNVADAMFLLLNEYIKGQCVKKRGVWFLYCRIFVHLR